MNTNEKVVVSEKNALVASLGLEGKSPVELFLENPTSLMLGRIPRELQTSEMAKLVISNRSYEMRLIPQELLTNEVCEFAIEKDPTLIQYTPESLITSSLALKAVKIPYRHHYEFKEYPIYYIPQNLITKELVWESIKNSPCSLKNVPLEFVTDKIIRAAVSGDGMALEFVSEDKRTKDICEIAFNNTPFALKWIPEDYITREMRLAIIESPNCIERSNVIMLDSFKTAIRNDKELLDRFTQKSNETEQLKLKKQQSAIEQGKREIAAIIKELQVFDNDYSTIQSEQAIDLPDNQRFVIHEFSGDNDSASRKVYYITDIHLEHQLKELLNGSNINYCNVWGTIRNFLNEKISEMLSDVDDKRETLLIGGDVAHTKELLSLFYQRLSRLWSGSIISVLGNHELWNLSLEDDVVQNNNQTINEIVNDYRELLNKPDLFDKVSLLQNAVFIQYKGKQQRVIEEDQILNAADEDLEDICNKSSLIILGGIGFSGLNSVYNAEFGLYKFAVTSRQEDMALSARFREIYDKLNRCAGNKQVIVLTHTPVYDWTNEPCNPNWIYINGHTHQNLFVRKKDVATVLSDNQIGYKPKRWKLNAFTVSGWYDPFKYFNDGVHEISSEQYKEFNRGRGIQSNGCNYPGKKYALKRGGLYMFLLKSRSSLCLLQGGQRKRLDHIDISYYYENMPLYCQKVRQALLPYQQVIRVISTEVKRFGGWGCYHGCIIDIDYFCHIYVNPFDGKLTPYLAFDTNSRFAYQDILALLKSHKPELVDRFLLMQEKGRIPILSKYAVTTKDNLPEIQKAIIPDLVLGKEMYEPSKIMRSIQYILDDNVIRIWKDEILALNFGSTTIDERNSLSTN